MKKLCHLTLPLLLLTVLTQAQDQPDAAIMQKIRQEGLERSQVMDIAFRLTDANGPRLTNSPGYTRAAKYAIRQLTEWGLKNARLEPWGEFGKSWELTKSYLALTAPYYRPLIAFPQSWVRGTGGLKSAELLLITGYDSAYLSTLKGKLKGKILIADRSDAYQQSFKPDAERFTDERLQQMATGAATPPRPRDTIVRTATPARNIVPIVPALRKLADSEGAIAILSTSPRNHDGTVFVAGSGYQAGTPDGIAELAVTLEDYMPLVRMARAGIPVKLEVEVAAKSTATDTKAYNVLAEIPGSDPKLKPELVMLGGHLDSWQGGTGATDNASGCAVMMEAVRILQAIGVKPRRTVRIALWSGEEQGLLGSRAYVREAFKDDAAKNNFSAYYNLDNGTGKIRGIYLQGNNACGPIFSQWLEPFKDLGAGTVTLRNTGGTDHQSFDGLLLPGFQFIQDPIEYNTRTHHSTMDTYDHLVADDLKQAAVIVAAFVYNTAQREEKLPRKVAAR